MSSFPGRRGVAMLIVIAVFALIIVGISLAMKANLSARAESRQAARRLQAEYLAQSGLELAHVRLAGDAAYQGETWRVEAGELGGRDAALITIEVTAEQSDAAARRVTVVADYPAGEAASSTHRARISRIWKPSLPSETTP